MKSLRTLGSLAALASALTMGVPALAQAAHQPHPPPHASEHVGDDGAEHEAEHVDEHGRAAPHAMPDAHGEHEHTAHALGEINWTDFANAKQPPYLALLLNFAILVGIYVYFGRRPVAAALTKRRDDIAKEIEEAQRIRREAEERASVYQAKLRGLETQLAEARAALVEAGRGERDRIVREAEERAQRMTKDAILLLEQELAQMKQDLVRQTATQALRAAEELLRSTVTMSDQERLAEELLSDLARATPTRGLS